MAGSTFGLPVLRTHAGLLSMRPAALAPFLLMMHPMVAQPPNGDCATALTLCAQQSQAGNNTGATGPIPAFCQPGANQLWYSFTTNSQGGVVNVAVNGIDCADDAGADNELSVQVLSGDGSCTPAAFQSVSAGGCQQDSLDFVVGTEPLLPDTMYWVVVSGMADSGTPAQCAFSLTLGGPGADIVGVDFSAGPDVSLADGASTQLDATGGTTYTWTPTSGLSGNGIPDPFAQPTETTIYTVTTELNGCTYTDQVLVEVQRLIDPPNTITPNGDGKNDTWVIPGITDYPEADVKIYDRWGQRVFNAVGYRTPFDGGGLPTGTYYWVIELNVLEGRAEPYTGFLTIVN